jgi:alkylation response protein AidB-like acyl-CoA dehydrogenase
MEFQFTQKQIDFRNEVLNFLKTELPSDWPDRMKYWPGGYGSMELNEDPEMVRTAIAFKNKLAEKGWLTISWPKEYGGKQYSYMEQAIYEDLIMYYKAPGMGIATGIAGPSILHFGTEENKKDWIPPIARGEINLWLGYSEPDAGSDLAAMRTTAIEDGDDYIINGQKIWSSAAHLSDYAWLAAKTDPDAKPHKGMSMFIVDNKSPGVTIRPLINILGSHSFNEVFFDNVRVPKRNLIGQKNMGFYYLMLALDFERLMVGIGAFAKMLEELIAYVKTAQRDGRPLSENVQVRQQIAYLATRLEVAYKFFWRTADMLDKGQQPSVEASALKLICTELSRKMADMSMEIMGPYGQLTGPSPWTPIRGMIPKGYLDCISATVGAGSSEIQRNIVAQRGLGLPRK